MRMSPTAVEPTKKDPADEKSSRMSSPNSKPTLPLAGA